MKLTNYLQVYIICVFSIVSYSQELKQVPDSLSTKRKASWYFQEANEAIDQLGDHNKALSYFNIGYKIATELKNDSLIHVGTYYKGIITLGRGEAYYDEAENIFKNSLDYFLKTDNLLLAGKTCNQLGALALKRENEEETEKYFDLAYKYMSNSHKPIHAVTPAYNLAYIYIGKHKYDKALEPAKWVDEMYTAVLESKKYNISETDITKHKIKFIVGICYINSGKYDLGKLIVDNSLKAFKENKYYDGINSVYFHLRYFELKNGNYKKAVSLSDSILKYDNSKYLHEQKDRNNYIEEIKNLENISLQLDLANKEIELKAEKNTKLTWSLSLAAILIISLFAVSILLKQKNSTLKFLKVKAEEGERQKSKFIAMISHEIRTPLNALLGFSNLLLEENPQDHQKRHLNSIVSSADYLLNLVNNVLNLNDSETGILKLDNHAITMEPFVNNIANSFLLQINNKNNKLTVNYDSKIPVKLKSDSLKITQIIKNLLNNACKFTKDGNIWLNVTLFENNSDHCMVNFEVKDTGIGIPKEKFESIFESFSNETLNIKKEYDGIGIGLSIVKNLVNAFESEVIIESEVNRGSSFSFALKMFKLSDEVRPVKTTNNHVLKGKKVLVIEDNKINQILATKMLNNVEAIPEISANGLIGFETFKSKPMGYFNLILMDIHMPVMDGYEATKLIRKIDKNVPILALTATNLNNDKDTLNEKGLNAVIHKPYQVDAIYVVMKKFITEN